MRKLLSSFIVICMLLPALPMFSFAEENDKITGNPVTITDSVTGCTYKYIDFNGKNLIRPYMGMQSWTSDGKSFLCGVNGTGANGTMYMYNTETNEFTEIGPGTVHTHVEGVVGSDDCVYYIRYYDIMKYDTKTGENTIVLPNPTGFTPGALSISNDCNYITFTSNGNKQYWCEEGETGVFRYNIAEKKIECFGHKFPYSNIMNHHQINPADPDIVFVCHEASIGTGEGQVASYRHLYDREWTVDFKTGEFKNIFKQGKTRDNRNIIFTTHESWSASGKYLYINCYTNESPNGKGGCIIRCYPDGSHREFLKNTHSNPSLSVDHAMASGDDKFTVVDSNSGKYVYLLSNDTYEQFPIYYSETGFTDPETGIAKGHPYHPHANVASNHYKVHWGIERNGVVGVAWYDFTELARKVANGGRYPVNTYIDRISYKGLDCESEKVNYNGKIANHATADKYLYYDIDETVVDGVNERITLSFDYYDNTTNDLNLIYTDGVVTDNDLADSEDAKIAIERTGTNKWIHKEITINGNFENINPYRTDFKIGGNADTYIANLEVKDAPDASELYAGGDGTEENPYQIATAEQLKHFTDHVRTTTDKTEVDSNISYTATKVSDTDVTTVYKPKRYHVFTDKYFELTADINMSGETWTPIGNLVNVFNGHFNGNGHAISNIYISGTKPEQFDRYAFFGATGTDAEIKNLGLEKVICHYNGSDNKYSTIIDGEEYTYYDRIVGVAGFVSFYAGGTFENCYLKDAEVRDLKQQMNSGGTGGFFGAGYGTVEATEENGYNAMIARNCYVNGITLRAHSNTYGFIGPNLKPNNTAELDEIDSYRVTRLVEDCYSANVRRGYYNENSLGKSNENKAYDGGVYPFSSTSKNATYTNCYTTSVGEKTVSTADGTGYIYEKAELPDNAVSPTDIDDLNSGLVDNSNFYSDVKDINGGYPVHTEVYDLEWDGKTDKKPEGEGTKESPYLISSKEELLWFRNSVNTVSQEGYSNGYESCKDSYFKLISDIDYEGCEWEPVGNDNSVFNGHFDGNGHVIKNLHIINYKSNYSFRNLYLTAEDKEKNIRTKLYTDKLHKYYGFFGKTGLDSVVKNLGIENIIINYWNHDYYYNIEVDSENVVVASENFRARYNGGMVGYSDGKFINCYVKNGELKNMQRDINDYNIAGFVGYAGDTSVFGGCYVNGMKLASSQYSAICGFVGNASRNAEFADCYAANIVENKDFVTHTDLESIIYGFGYAETFRNNTRNCISTLSDYQAQTPGAPECDSRRSIGITGKTKEQLANTVLNYEGFAPDNFDLNINDGYPICLWQMSEKAKLRTDMKDAITALGNNYSLNALTGNITLPTTGEYGSTLSWRSGNTSVISNTGTVTRPGSDTGVTLTLNGEFGDATDIMTVNITVLKADNAPTQTPAPVLPPPIIPGAGGGGSSGGGGGGGAAAPVTPVTPTPTPVQSDSQFRDLPKTHWAYDNVMSLYGSGIVDGYDDNTIRPDNNILREEAVKLIMSAFDLKSNGDYNTSFNDVAKTAWYYDVVMQAAELGIVNGITENQFGTGRNITRQDLAVIFYRISGLESIGEETAFLDHDKISDYAKEAVAALENAGVINGDDDGFFNPKGTSTRAQAITMILRLMQIK